MSYYVCPLCGARWFDHDANPCVDCGCRWPYPIEDAGDALELAESIQGARCRRLSPDDRETVGEVCAAYNGLDERVAKIEWALGPLFAQVRT